MPLPETLPFKIQHPSVGNLCGPRDTDHAFFLALTEGVPVFLQSGHYPCFFDPVMIMN